MWWCARRIARGKRGRLWRGWQGDARTIDEAEHAGERVRLVAFLVTAPLQSLAPLREALDLARE